MLRRSLALAVVATALCMAATSCGDDQAQEPEVPDIDFTPVLTVVVDQTGIRLDAGRRDLPGVSLDPPRAPVGSVVEVRNEGDAEHRVVGNDGIALDTGVLLPGERTTVVLAEADEIALREFSRPDDVIALMIEGPAAAGD